MLDAKHAYSPSLVAMCPTEWPMCNTANWLFAQTTHVVRQTKFCL